MAEKLMILNGPHAGLLTEIDSRWLGIGDQVYEQIADPDTGAGLGVYVHAYDRQHALQVARLVGEVRLMAKRWTLRRYRGVLEAAARHIDLGCNTVRHVSLDKIRLENDANPRQ